MKIAIVNINLEYKFPNETSEKDIMMEIENAELPSEYIEDSWEFVKIVEESE